jgi:hypothetical protein
MPRADAAELFAKSCGSQPHPDGTTLRGMGFATFLAEAFGDHDAVKQINGLALAHAQAIVHVLESSGYTITHRNDPNSVDTVGIKVATIQCHCGRLPRSLVQVAVRRQPTRPCQRQRVHRSGQTQRARMSSFSELAESLGIERPHLDPGTQPRRYGSITARIHLDVVATALGELT